jgi:hypothetical protein
MLFRSYRVHQTRYIARFARFRPSYLEYRLFFVIHESHLSRQTERVPKKNQSKIVIFKVHVKNKETRILLLSIHRIVSTYKLTFLLNRTIDKDIEVLVLF